ncbi:hypothetical protein RJ640_003905, partial [Escallonia rubra]
ILGLNIRDLSMAASGGEPGSVPSLGHEVIPMVNRLQDIFARVGDSPAAMELPQVAVVGSQSSGKSSVLEALVGRDFLPRGADICTRRPLLLQLVRTPEAAAGEYGEFRHLPGKKFYDFAEIRSEIQVRHFCGQVYSAVKQILCRLGVLALAPIMVLVDRPAWRKMEPMNAADWPSKGIVPPAYHPPSRTHHTHHLTNLRYHPTNVSKPVNNPLKNGGVVGGANRTAAGDGIWVAAALGLGWVVGFRLGWLWRCLGVWVATVARLGKAETARGAGGNKGVSNKQIRLTIYSPNVLDITLLDLPGMTKVPVGDQPSDIEAQIRTMILSYIRQPFCLILAVTPANSDLANSDALQIAGIADPDGNYYMHFVAGNRTIGVITKLDIMDRGTDACKHLLGKVIPLRLGYVGVVNRSQQDIMLNRSIKDALASEEAFFRSHPVYNGLADRCGIPRLAKKLNQILVQHIQKVLPELKSRISSKLLSVGKEHSSYGDLTESKSGQGALLLKILSKYSEAFASLVDGRNEERLTSELYGGARIQHIFQSIFVNHLEEVDPFDNLTDEDIRTAVQNATGPRSALFVPEVPFQVLVRRQIARLLDPSLQCARFIYNELVKVSHCCHVSELLRFPVLRKNMDEVVGNFLLEGLEPSETMIGHIMEMEIDYINTSHPRFIGGSNAVEVALNQIRSNRLSAPTHRPRDGIDSDVAPASDGSPNSGAIVVRSQANGFVTNQGVRSVAEVERNGPSGGTNGSSWGFKSIFRGRENHPAARQISRSDSHNEPVYSMEHTSSVIHLQEPPTVVRSSEMHSEQEAFAIAVTKLLLESYYNIVRKNIQDLVPKAIMHFLVNHTKRELHDVLITKLYKENLFEELLRENEEVAIKRKRARETLQVLQQAYQTLQELPLEAEAIKKGYSQGTDSTGLWHNPRV